MPTFLIAVKNSERFDTADVLQLAGYSFYVISSINDRLEIPADTIMAFVDEDFDGPQTGWHLASKMRQTNQPVKIVMLARKNPDIELSPLYDVVWGLPFNFEALKADFERQLKMR